MIEFPIESFRHMEVRISALRSALMSTAMRLAAQRGDDVQVTPDDVDHVFDAAAPSGELVRVGVFEGEPAAALTIGPVSFALGQTFLRQLLVSAAHDLAQAGDVARGAYEPPVCELRDLVERWIASSRSTAGDEDLDRQRARYHETGSGAIFDPIPEAWK